MRCSSRYQAHELRRQPAVLKRTVRLLRSTCSTSRPALNHARDCTWRPPADSFSHHCVKFDADAGSGPTRRSISSNVSDTGPSAARHRNSNSGSYFATFHRMPAPHRPLSRRCSATGPVRNESWSFSVALWFTSGCACSFDLVLESGLVSIFFGVRSSLASPCDWRRPMTTRQDGARRLLRGLPGS